MYSFDVVDYSHLSSVSNVASFAKYCFTMTDDRLGHSMDNLAKVLTTDCISIDVKYR